MGLLEKFNSEETLNFLKSRLEYIGEIHKIAALKGGRSNPSFLLDTDRQKFVIRCQPEGKLLSKAHDMGREFKVLSALKDTDFPIPEVFFLCQDKSLIGVDFYVMSFVEGDISHSFYLEHLQDDQKKHSYIQMVEVLADLHELDLTKLGLQRFGKEGSYYERQYYRWQKAFEASGHPDVKEFSELSEWLKTNLPQNEERVLIHGDYRLDNIVFDESTRNIKAILDWELSTLGDGLSDLGYFLGILEAPKDFAFSGFGNVDRSSFGIPEENELLEIYCERRGIESIENWPFYKSFGYFRLAAICAGIYGRVNQGNAVDSQSTYYAQLVQPLSGIACSMII